MEERKNTEGKLGTSLAIEIPEDDIEVVAEGDKEKLREQMKSAEEGLTDLIGEDNTQV